MSKVRDKIASNGFTKQDILSLRRVHRELKRVYHPELTSDLSLESVIAEEAIKSFSLTKYYLIVIVLTTLIAIFAGRADYLFMPALFLIMTIHDIFSSSRGGQRKVSCELKLMKLAFRMYF
ncbi:hypothetical protein LU604_05175 [Erwinia tracheiphila]|uniref:Uncharacterized protein n=1 Tax=Erwinia tracheiphila TaxID=65700 RepID=A0A345CU14_9GAMM|nr:hypothetical protein [Erwinia tracheiphila]AXF76931.1 hypothetical protein AV903_14160 [Erwinia tracheiphila]UIA84392.1 hypothetical protein LU604_05175 [Erwinia tracheiphila]UIA92972.1 hypothetical protein LU632_05100 [Erwinia tracheiphila]